MDRARHLPLLLLAGYATAWGVAAFGAGLPVFDDHPGQLYRLHHAVSLGLAPWRWNPGWWAGYAELQFYPPGFSYLGALLHAAAVGRLSVEATYRVLLWVTWLLPGLGVYALLARLLPRPWLALPAAVLALTLSAESRSGAEEGVRWGLVAARLGWGLLPLLALSLLRWAGGDPRAPVSASLLLAAVVLVHPAHVPAGLALIGLAALVGSGTPARRLGDAALLTGLGLGLAAFWMLPLLAHLSLALPLAWGDADLAALGRKVLGRPLIVVLAAANLAGWIMRGRGRLTGTASVWLLALAPLMTGLLLTDVFLGSTVGIRWIPADRLVDSLYLALILGGAVSLGAAARHLPRVPAGALGLAALAVTLPLAAGSPEPTLSLWPGGRSQWPSYTHAVAGTRLGDLWAALREVPPGRILFVRSSVPLRYGAEWWRPHSHLMALTPVAAGRDIVNGTFTHPSPVAGFLYSGSASAPVTRLVEQRDGETLFGRPLATLRPEEFDRLSAGLAISAVVALDEDAERLGFLTAHEGFGGPRRIGPFLLFVAKAAAPGPEAVAPGHLRLLLPAGAGGFVPAGIGYSPLWTAHAAGRALATRRGEAGLLEIRVPARQPLFVDLLYGPGLAEWAGVGLSLACLLLMCFRRRLGLTR
ncbi:MAG: hypothetical protein HYV93_13250 [Candidatus Rokubacteria bacterium]|nr:hypothetical protein [Candidatus Rokubacteria bacterium]